ncbi:MAG: glycosyltransferase [Bacteroidia bacterium]|nr:glycosyltransferase [Bacteroidia bacterium]
MKLLVLSSRFPYPLLKGDKLRLYHQLYYLAQYHDISLVSVVTKMPDSRDIDHLSTFISDIRIITLPKWRRFLNITTHLFRNTPLQVAYFHSPHTIGHVQKLIDSIKPDHIYIQLIRMIPYIEGIKEIPMTLDYMDAFSLGASRRADESKAFWSKCIWRMESKRLGKYEKDKYPLFENHTIISERDKNLLIGDGNRSFTIISNGIEVPTPVDLISDYDIGFLGNLGYYPNQVAVDYLVNKILPRLKAKKQDIKVLICGTSPSSRIRNYASESIHIVGYIDHILEAYRDVKILVAPIFQGSGMQNKILEAMAARVACITTSNVNASIQALPQKQIMIADTVDEFCRAIELLLQNEKKRKQLVEEAYLFVQKHYDWNISNKKLNALFSRKSQNSTNVI